MTVETSITIATVHTDIAILLVLPSQWQSTGVHGKKTGHPNLPNSSFPVSVF